MGNGISTATRSRVAVCIAALSLLIGLGSPAFAKVQSARKVLDWGDKAHKVADGICKGAYGQNFPTEGEKRTWGKAACRLEQHPVIWYREHEPDWLQNWRNRF
jgi:hypothetical protein